MNSATFDAMLPPVARIGQTTNILSIFRLLLQQLMDRRGLGRLRDPAEVDGVCEWMIKREGLADHVGVCGQELRNTPPQPRQGVTDAILGCHLKDNPAYAMCAFSSRMRLSMVSSGAVW